jgi:hypothetical protein
MWILVLAGLFRITLQVQAGDWPRWGRPDLNGISKV